MLDAGPLGMIAHPKANEQVIAWLRSMLESGTEVIIPEISDYEVRRSLLREGLEPSVRKLDQLKAVLHYSSITTAVMLQAAQFWADCRRRGRPSCSPDALDGDVILAAQARVANAVVVTDNAKHLDELVKVLDWKEHLSSN